MITLVTSCSSRKRSKEAELRLSDALVGTGLNETILNWRKAISERNSLYHATDLYAGRAINEARHVATLLGSPLFFVSAGMGIVSPEDKIPAYNLTPVESGDGLSFALNKHSASAADWWSKLSSNALSQLIRDHKKRLFLIALPSSYLRMLSDDLSGCSENDANRLRIFTSSAGAEELPDVLRSSVIPYDERLETVFEFAGTRSDFPQRAMRHYVEILQGHKHELSESQHLVKSFMGTCGNREIPIRRRLSDNEIKSLISRRWSSCKGQSSQLLRALRDEELVACEQSRFSKLWREVKNERNSQLADQSQQ
jgi:hypothetical protein